MRYPRIGESGQDKIKKFRSSCFEKLNAFRLKIFFTDKDKEQMNSICCVYGVILSYCLWHIKKSIPNESLRFEKSEMWNGIQRGTPACSGIDTKTF